jgi:hypothetical protein
MLHYDNMHYHSAYFNNSPDLQILLQNCNICFNMVEKQKDGETNVPQEHITAENIKQRTRDFFPNIYLDQIKESQQFQQGLFSIRIIKKGENIHLNSYLNGIPTAEIIKRIDTDGRVETEHTLKGFLVEPCTKKGKFIDLQTIEEDYRSSVYIIDPKIGIKYPLESPETNKEFDCKNIASTFCLKQPTALG